MRLLTNLLFEPKGMHNQNVAYNIKDTVMSGDGSRVYFAIQDVPAGIPLNDSNYWKLQIDLSGSKSAMDQALASFGNYAKEIGMRVRGETAKATGNPVSFLPDAGSLLQPVTALEPQQQGSGDPSPSNIRPFIGYDKLGLGVRGKNIFPAWAESSYTMNGVTFTKQADGSIRAQGTPAAYAYITLTDYKTLREHGFAEGVHTISGLPVESDAWFVDLIGDANSPNINFYRNSAFDVSAELSRGGTYAWRIVITPNAGMIDLTFRIQVEAGSTPSSFAPCQSRIHTVQIGQTVCGFRYEWLTGKLMAEWAVKAFDGTENGWVVQRFNNLVAYCPVYDMMLMPRYLTSSHFKSYENISGAPNGTIGIAQEGISAGLEGAFFGIEGIASTVDEWKSFLAAQFAAGTPVQITYKLKTPIEIQLSPTSISAADPEQVNTLYGDGSIEVEYVKPLHASIGGGSAPVQSVNGKTGNVQLSASDVGAASKDDVDKLSEEIVDLSMHGPADLTDEQKAEWQVRIGLSDNTQVTLVADTLVNGVPGNGGNALCVSTGAFDITDATALRIHTDRPVNDGCTYAVGYIFAEKSDTFGSGFDFYQSQGFISRLHAHNSTIDDATMIEVPDGAKFARFTMTMYNKGTGEYVPLRATDFAGYSILITCDMAQKEQPKSIKEQNPDAVSNLFAAARYGHNSMGVENNNKRFAMIATTDIHAYADRLGAAVVFANEIPCVDCGVTLGDIASEHYSDTNGAWYSDSISESNVPWLTVIGNHDMGNSESVGESATQAQAFAKWIAPNLGIAGVTSDTSYYCKDFATYNLRLIVLNAYDAPDTLDGNGNFVVSRKVQCISQAQANWLVSTLAATPAGYTVAVLTHSNPGKGVKDTNVHFNHATKGFANEDTQGTLIPEIIAAWMDGTALNKTFTSTNNNVPVVSVSADFTNRGVGVFAGYILGHTHRDLVGHVEGYEGQKLYGFSATAVGNWQNGEDELPRVTGDRSIDAITAVCIDTEARQVFLVRIGSDISFDLNRRDPVAISY